MRFILASFILLVLVAGCLSTTISEVIISSGSGQVQKIVKVEVAQTESELQRGLMFRSSLDPDSGMLFIFDSNQPLSFWMKNTLIPLDMLFISDKYQIVDITTMQPCQKDPCPAYTSKAPARYVLEVNAGYASSNNITVGGKIVIHSVSK